MILDPADAMGEEAANALLKTLEEPPPHTQFILVSSRSGALLQTVRSRSQRVRFGPVPAAALGPWLAVRGLSPELARDAMGSPGLALRLAEGEAADRAQTREGLLSAMGQPLHKLFVYTETAGKKGEDGEAGAARVVDALEETLRDVACMAAGRAPLHPHPMLATWTRALWPGGLGRMERAVAQARDRLRLNVNGRTVLDALLSALNLELSQVTR